MEKDDVAKDVRRAKQVLAELFLEAQKKLPWGSLGGPQPNTTAVLEAVIVAIEVEQGKLLATIP